MDSSRAWRTPYQGAIGAPPALREVSFDDVRSISLLGGSMMPNKLEGSARFK